MGSVWCWYLLLGWLCVIGGGGGENSEDFGAIQEQGQLKQVYRMTFVWYGPDKVADGICYKMVWNVAG